MSDRDDSARRSLTRSGQSRRRFLEGTALAAAGTSAALLPGLGNAVTVAAKDAVPASCPAVVAPMKDVEGKVAFITGGDSGIGLGIARAFVDAGIEGRDYLSNQGASRRGDEIPRQRWRPRARDQTST
ncbi:MAG: hypothetical protein WDO56_27910 [Gammaproteobacteria bacterium]